MNNPPTPRADQSKPSPDWTPADPKVGWYMTGPNQGYFFDKDPAPAAAPWTPPVLQYPPYVVPGLLAALTQVTLGTDNALNAKVVAALEASPGIGQAPGNAYSSIINHSSGADPTWNTALRGLVLGHSLNDVWRAAQKAIGQHDKTYHDNAGLNFNDTTLANAQALIAQLRVAPTPQPKPANPAT